MSLDTATARVESRAAYTSYRAIGQRMRFIALSSTAARGRGPAQPDAGCPDDGDFIGATDKARS